MFTVFSLQAGRTTRTKLLPPWLPDLSRMLTKVYRLLCQLASSLQWRAVMTQYLDMDAAETRTLGLQGPAQGLERSMARRLRGHQGLL